MGYGYSGRILRIDLTTEKFEIETQSEDFYRTYGGGSALNMYYMLKEMDGGVDPLGPDNLLCLSTGVTTGLSVPGASRLVVSAKSPLTGMAGDSQSGGYFPAELKFSGFDGVIIKGRADRPLYLAIIDGTPTLHEADHLWGKDTGEVDALIKNELGQPQAKILQCGLAGEKMVRFAALISMCTRANGRNGMGAVMGSKNLRAISVKGRQQPTVFDKDALTLLAQKSRDLLPRLGTLAQYGTPSSLIGKHHSGTLPTRNFTSGIFEGAEAISGMRLWNDFLKGREIGNQNKEGRATCYGCNVRCKRVVEIKEGTYEVDPKYGGPEYETLASFGSYCGVDDMSSVVKCNELCNRYGMDTLSLGGTLAWVMECVEQGLLETSQLDSVDLQFGNGDAMVEMVHKIAHRDGVGDILALGSERAAEYWGTGYQFLTTTKKQETPGHMPHIKLTCALIYAVNPFGSDHQSHEHDPAYEEEGYEPYADRLSVLDLNKPQPYMSLNEEKVRFARRTQYFYSFDDTMALCQFVWGPAWHVYGPEHTVQLVRAASGWQDFDIDELLTMGERRINLMRAFNAREGADYRLDTLPEKFHAKGLKGGPSDGVFIDRNQLQHAVSEYYSQAGWNKETGNPLKKTYERLGIGWVVEILDI